MAVTYTENYHLGKQENTADKFGMSVITQNMDVIDAELYKKVEKENGKGLSSNDYTDTEKAAVGTIGGKASAADLTAHTGNTEIHITAAEKAKLKEQNKYLTPETIAADSDLDDFVDGSNYRIYYTQTQAITNTILNKPADWTTGTFVLEVMRIGGSQYLQRLTHQSYGGSVANIYVRTKVASTTETRWNPWFKVALTKVETTETVSAE